MLSHAGSQGNDSYNYLCLEIPSCKEINMPPTENSSSPSSLLINELFFFNSPPVPGILFGFPGQHGVGKSLCSNLACPLAPTKVVLLCLQ